MDGGPWEPTPGLLCGSTKSHVSRGHRLAHCPGHLAPWSPLWLYQDPCQQGAPPLSLPWAPGPLVSSVALLGPMSAGGTASLTALGTWAASYTVLSWESCWVCEERRQTDSPASSDTRSDNHFWIPGSVCAFISISCPTSCPLTTILSSLIT